MQKLEKFLGRGFVISSTYLLALILGGFFILPGVFQVQDYDFPLLVELFLKITATVSVCIVLLSAVALPMARVLRRQKPVEKSPLYAAAATMLVGMTLIFLSAVYVKLRTCLDDDEAWHCNFEGKSFLALLVLTFFAASLVGFIAWLVKLSKRPQR